MGKRVFSGRNVDLARLTQAVESYLSSKGYTTQRYQSSDQSYVVQAKKGGFLRAVVSAQRAFTVHISGSPQNVVVNVGVANWGQDIAVDAVETLLVSPDLGLLSAAETLWNLKIEKEILDEIQRIIQSGQADYSPAAGFQQPQPQPPNIYPPQTPQYPPQPQYSSYAQQSQPQRFCPMCGSNNPASARYCMNCGAQLA